MWGEQVCVFIPTMFVCVCAWPFMCGKAVGTGNFLCSGREKLGHFIFSCVRCQKGQRSKVRAIGEFRAACRQIWFQGWGRAGDCPEGIGAYVSVRTYMYAYIHVWPVWAAMCVYALCLFGPLSHSLTTFG